MCYGSGCIYEHKGTGECKFGFTPKPPDAACAEEFLDENILEDDTVLDNILRLADLQKINEEER